MNKFLNRTTTSQQFTEIYIENFVVKFRQGFKIICFEDFRENFLKERTKSEKGKPWKD